MSLRLASRALARPSLSRSSAVVVPLQNHARFQSSSTPSQKASAILDAIPGNSLISKTSTAVLATGLTAAAISNELFVLNEEVVILGSFIIFLGAVANVARPAYREWADGQIEKVKSILNESRTAHTDAVKSRIENVGELKDVETLTKSLFDLSKQTAELEHETYALQQKAALSADVKSVLDSWVRHEAQVREAEQRDLVKTVLENVTKQLADKKLQREILVQSVAEIESLVKNKAI